MQQYLKNTTYNKTLISNISFKTKCYRKNYDLTIPDEHIITEYEGEISLLRINEKKLPKLIGEFGFSVWDVSLGEFLNINIEELLEAQSDNTTYSNMLSLIKNNEFNYKKYNKILFIHTLIIKEEFRNNEIGEEFVEYIYRDFHNENTAIVFLALPFQYDDNQMEYYSKHKKININEMDNVQNKTISAYEYYSLDKFMDKNDYELNKLKIYSTTHKYGFDRISNSDLFIMNHHNILNRMLKKY
jgi:hypothetical protein